MANISKAIKNLYGPLTKILLLSDGFVVSPSNNEHGIYNRVFLKELEQWGLTVKQSNKENNSSFKRLIEKATSYLNGTSETAQMMAISDMTDVVGRLWAANNILHAETLLIAANKHLKDNHSLAKTFTTNLIDYICFSELISARIVTSFASQVKEQYGIEMLQECTIKSFNKIAQKKISLKNITISNENIKTHINALPLSAQFLHNYIDSFIEQKHLTNQINIKKCTLKKQDDTTKNPRTVSPVSSKPCKRRIL